MMARVGSTPSELLKLGAFVAIERERVVFYPSILSPRGPYLRPEPLDQSSLMRGSRGPLLCVVQMEGRSAPGLSTKASAAGGPP